MSNNHRIHLCLAHMSPTGAELRYIQEAFSSNWVAPLGPNVDAFEKELERFLNTSVISTGADRRSGEISDNKVYVAAVSSCTAAIHLALLLLGVGKDDEVLCQSFSFCASSNPVVYCGAKPVFIDSEKETWNMSPELLEDAINDRMAKTGKKPKAIIVVDLYGMPAKWEEITAISKKYDIPVIEDAANALGSYYKGKPCGTFGDIATLSFNGNKMITTSGGGAIICKDEETKKRAIFLATQAKEPFLHYEHEMIGYNYRMSNICAGIGRGQMTVLEDHINHHKHVHELYQELFKNVDGVHIHSQPCNLYNPHAALIAGEDTLIAGADPQSHEMPDQVRHEAFNSNFWLTNIVFKKDIDTESFCLELDKAGIEARPLWKPMHLQPVYKDYPAFTNGFSEYLFKHGICLPSGPWVTDDDVKYIVQKIKEAIVF
ncbi:MAG: aminotransferase class I/II-fold pyridoxal phosphate-dependent enzyme [Bacteroidales bacterium]|nr:aminotransferase class I/II-fold pyridoxal phosphate-dependent enzyme [Bacteroidales bacterium]